MQNSDRLVLRVERDSVCAGDGVDAPHAANFELARDDSVAHAVSAVVRARYLPEIAGGAATWIVRAGDQPLAVVAQQWDAPKFLTEASTRTPLATLADAPALFFRYECQVDPSEVLACLRTGRPLPDRHGRGG